MNGAPLFVVVAHQDDWPLFMGKEVFAHLRRGEGRVAIVITTAGDAGDTQAHWRSRFSGTLLALLRALPSWSPYDEPQSQGYAVRYERVRMASKWTLRASVSEGERERACIYLLHLPDGGAAGNGFAPAFASLKRLHEGSAVTALWPAEDPSVYRTWGEFEAVLAAIVARERGGAAAMPVFAADPDTQRNPGDHADHRYTSLALAHLAQGDPSLRPVWFKTYCVAELDENLAPAECDDQRAAIFAYGGGYGAAAAGYGERWRTGWEREYPRVRARQYPRDADEVDASPSSPATAPPSRVHREP